MANMKPHRHSCTLIPANFRISSFPSTTCFIYSEVNKLATVNKFVLTSTEASLMTPLIGYPGLSFITQFQYEKTFMRKFNI